MNTKLLPVLLLILLFGIVMFTPIYFYSYSHEETEEDIYVTAFDYASCIKLTTTTIEEDGSAVISGLCEEDDFGLYQTRGYKK